ncbi:embryo-specific protein ATS3B [Trifolium repens]|nr:embryo-specific protein ATS3B [Trifolium repens]
MKFLTFILTFASIVAFSQATPSLVTHPQPQMDLYTMLNHTQQHINETGIISNSCTYDISIKTSCSSLKHTTDEIGILIGDADGNEVLAQLVAGNYEFDRCMIAPFTVLGSCLGKICKVYLARIGSDGWKPESIIAYHDAYPPTTFNFNYFIPENRRSGFDYCITNS